MKENLTLKNAAEKLGISQNVIDGWFVNPLSLVAHHFFMDKSKDFSKVKKSYQEKAIDYCIKKMISFCSDCNTVYDLSVKFVNVTCPKCGKIIDGKGGSGNGSEYTTNYNCDECGTRVNLTFVTNGIGVTFADDV